MSTYHRKSRLTPEQRAQFAAAIARPLSPAEQQEAEFAHRNATTNADNKRIRATGRFQLRNVAKR